MNTSANPTENAGSQDQMVSAMFASMVMQNTNMALIFLGQAPNPQTGKTELDLDSARYFIDQLEMIAVKTKGNLDKQEDGLLKQSLTHLRLSFVEAVEHPPKTEAAAPAPATPSTSGAASPPADEQETPVIEPVLPGEKAAETESRKKFSKKY